MYSTNVYVLSHPLWNVILALLCLVALLYVAKWVISFIPMLGS